LSGLRTLLPLLLLGALAYGAVVMLIYLFQGRLLYLPSIPGRSLIGTPADIGLTFEDMGLLTADGLRLHAWFVPAAGARQVVLFCHGNAGNISHRLDWLRILHGLGLSTLIFDYRGYGASAGSPDEAGTYMDAEAAWRQLTSERGYQPAQVILFGESLGGAVAAHLARQVTPGALVLASTFTSVTAVAAHHYRFLPVRWLSRFRYAAADDVADVRAPVLIIHSRDDEIVPFAHGQEIYRRAREPKTFLEISGDHNGAFMLSEAQLTAGLQRFLAAVPR
jgi:fermentation-respiration switch protein FrsA (DUF1100 family)